ncbi:hypothetical protein [Pseudarthrobacter raffinosi]|uniref:hypothetical protein n=1 Tax=Pseudarthrobacter raffinosi TaxID=2953651 RepID=UPI00208FC168|nr:MULTISPECIES: hypothetical protein [unclassified Pseudarthrobacter]MCO4251566.1 hypothetical protein [Pseudarthrobacter sp. MDT3-9]MCO4264585.1 hypothetical protein [Pseudarthrobacter sp. MDT3-26]
MKIGWEGEEEDRLAAIRAAQEMGRLEAHVTGTPIVIANEFSEVQVSRVETRNGSRLMIKSPRSGQWVSLCPLELESLTWQAPATFSAMIGHPFGPLITEDEQPPQNKKNTNT